MARLTAFLVAALLAVSVTAYPPSKPACKQCVSSPNNCDITAPCSNFEGFLYCGCRPGYKATGVTDNDPHQWRISTVAGHEHRVWVSPGTICDTLCDFPFGTDVCGEIHFNDQCPPKPY